MSDVKRGRPRVYDRDILLRQLERYTAETAIPIISEFAGLVGCTRQKLYEMPELDDALDICIAKKEAALERGGLEGTINCQMAIFSLKQLGWRDTREQTLRANPDAPVKFTLLGSDIPTHA